MEQHDTPSRSNKQESEQSSEQVSEQKHDSASSEASQADRRRKTEGGTVEAGEQLANIYERGGYL